MISENQHFLLLLFGETIYHALKYLLYASFGDMKRNETIELIVKFCCRVILGYYDDCLYWQKYIYSEHEH
jgi:hypothetical protein